MTITLHLPESIEQALRARAVAEGTRIEDLAVNILSELAVPSDSPLEDILDHEYHAECEADASPMISLEETRKILSKIPGSMTADFISERDER